MKKNPIQRAGSPAKPMFTCVGGASDSGKSSFRDLNPEAFRSFTFHDVDQVTADLEKGPDFPKGTGWQEARRRVDQAIQKCMENKESFGTETTFILQERIDLLIHAKNQGCRTKLLFLGTEDVKINILRVRKRVKGGGHDVPEETVKNDWREAPKNLEKNLFNIDIVESYESKASGEVALIAIKEEDHQFDLYVSDEDIPEWARGIVNKGLSGKKFEQELWSKG